MEAGLFSKKTNNLPSVLILAGGMGTRLQSVVSAVPKPLAPAAGKPFLFYLVQHLLVLGFRDFVVSLHHHADQVIQYFEGNPDFSSATIRCVTEPKPLQTGGAVLFAATALGLREPFFVINGDTLFSGDITRLSQDFVPGQISMALAEVSDASRYGAVMLDGKGSVTRFLEKEGLNHAGLINAGIYFLELSTLEKLGFSSGDVFSFEKNVFPALTDSHQIVGHKISGSFIDIGIPTDYFRFKSQVEK